MLAGRVVLPVGLSADTGTDVPLILFADNDDDDVVDVADVDNDVAPVVEHDTHGHGPPSFFNKTERNFSAGPSFMPNECIK